MMFLPWRDHSFLFDEDDIEYWERINNPVESVTGETFVETGQTGKEIVTQDILYFDGLIPPDDIPNHLLLLYLNIGVFLLITGLIFSFIQFNIVILSLIMIIMGVLNIIFQVIFVLKKKSRKKYLYISRSSR